MGGCGRLLRVGKVKLPEGESLGGAAPPSPLWFLRAGQVLAFYLGMGNLDTSWCYTKACDRLHLLLRSLQAKELIQWTVAMLIQT